MSSDSQHTRRASRDRWLNGLLLLVLATACDVSGPLPVETSFATGARNLSEVVHVSELGPSDAELSTLGPNAADPASVLALAGRGAAVAAHVFCTAAASRRVGAFPGVVTDYALETRARLGGDPVPSQITLPGGRAEGIIVDVSAATVPEPGAYYVAFFSKRAASASGTGSERDGLDPLHLQALLPASMDGDVRMGERTFALSEVRQLALEVGK